MKTCLVVDDSSVIRKVAKRILEGMDFQITEAEDGQQALDQCQRMLPDAILLDWNMPKMDGYDFLKALRRMPGGYPRLAQLHYLWRLIRMRWLAGRRPPIQHRPATPTPTAR